MSTLEPEVPGNLWDDMPPETYCKCGGTWVGEATKPAGFRISVRMKCPACGFWTDAVPTSTE